jgi:hypothetical protein
MKKFTLKAALVAGFAFAATTEADAQNVLYSQNFEDTVNYASFDELMEGWLNWDLDGFTDANGRDPMYFWTTYPTAIDTNVTPWDTTYSLGAGSSSWQEGFVGPTDNQLVSPVIALDAGTTASLSWDSKPFQGPRYMDGYRVVVMVGSSQDDWDAGSGDVVFDAAENVGSPGAQWSDQVFEGDWIHDSWLLVDAADSSRMFPNPVTNTVDLSSYAGQDIMIGFVHDSNDDNGLYIDNLEITGDGTYGVGMANNQAEKFNLVVFPNPAFDNARVSFNLENAEQVVVNVYDITGKVVSTSNEGTLAAGAHNIDLNVSDLPAGIYNVSIQVGGEFANTTIVVE